MWNILSGCQVDLHIIRHLMGTTGVRLVTSNSLESRASLTMTGDMRGCLNAFQIEFCDSMVFKKLKEQRFVYICMKRETFKN